MQQKTYSYDHENMGVSVVSGGVYQVQGVSGWSSRVQRHIGGSRFSATHGVPGAHIITQSLEVFQAHL